MDQDEFFESLARDAGGDDVEILEVVAVEEESAPRASRDGGRRRPEEESPAVPAEELESQPETWVIDARGGSTRAAAAVDDLEELSAQEALLRLRADYDNMRKRIERERVEFQAQANADLVSRLLPVLDNFERALVLGPKDCSPEQLREGLELIYRQLNQELRREGLRSIEAVGRMFDPNLHDAVATGASATKPAETVIEEFQRGYLFRDRVLRPALVRVATVCEDHPEGQR
jgi:molecular chaperone GrpE